MEPAEQRDRRRRIEAPPPPRARQQGPTSFTVTWDGMPVIIRSTAEDVAAGTMMVQRIRYRDDPPVEGDVEAIGPEFEAYPLWTARYSHYVGFVWGPDDPITLEAYPMIAIRDRNSWVLMMPLKADGSVLDPDAPTSGCSRG